MDLHRYLMQKHLGRELTRKEAVHHKDMDKENNDISNLEIIDLSEHSRMHMKGNVIAEEVKQKMRVLSYLDAASALIMSSNGMSLNNISIHFNCSKATIYRLVDESKRNKDMVFIRIR